MAKNPWKQFEGLIKSDRLQVGEVTAHNADGTSTLQTPEGNNVVVDGQGVSVGTNAYYQQGRIVDKAPALTVYSETV